MLSFNLSHFQLPTRHPPRPADLQQPNYHDLFDHDTFIYDAFYRDQQLTIITPPLPRSAWDFAFKHIELNAKKIHRKFFSPIKLFQSPRVDKAIIKADHQSIHLFDIVIPPIDSELPKTCRNVLYTMQKNNKIEWINDWIDWHVSMHGVQAVIIYDNHSDHYDLDELIQKTKRTDDVVIIIVACPFKHGPSKWQGGTDDSTYLQTAMLEHVRYKYCHHDTRLLQCDIDELIFTKHQQSIFDFCEIKKSVCVFPGQWIELPKNKDPAHAVHKDHQYLDYSRFCPNKWVANLEDLPHDTFLNIHGVYGNKTIEFTSSAAQFLHFRCISTDWKYKRLFSLNYDQDKFKVLDWTQSDKFSDVIFK